MEFDYLIYNQTKQIVQILANSAKLKWSRITEGCTPQESHQDSLSNQWNSLAGSPWCLVISKSGD